MHPWILLGSRLLQLCRKSCCLQVIRIDSDHLGHFSQNGTAHSPPQHTLGTTHSMKFSVAQGQFDVNAIQMWFPGFFLMWFLVCDDTLPIKSDIHAILGVRNYMYCMYFMHSIRVCAATKSCARQWNLEGNAMIIYDIYIYIYTCIYMLHTIGRMQHTAVRVLEPCSVERNTALWPYRHCPSSEIIR